MSQSVDDVASRNIELVNLQISDMKLDGNLDECNPEDLPQQIEPDTNHPINADNNNKEKNEVYNKDDQFFKFKKHVKNKRKSTFCCIFSCGSLLLSVILFLGPLCTQMLDDFNLYQKSMHLKCSISNITAIPNHSNYTKTKTNNNFTESMQCKYQYMASNKHQLSAKCGYTFSEIARCQSDPFLVGYVSDCIFYEKKDECNGTMLDTPTLIRNNNMFIILLGIGSMFAFITIFSGIYAIRLIGRSGIYCSIKAVQRDDDKIFRLMQTLQKKEKKKKRKHRKNKHKKKGRKHTVDDDDDCYESTLLSSQNLTQSTIVTSLVSSNTINSTLSGDEFNELSDCAESRGRTY